MIHTLPTLEYPYNALEPFIDAETMEIHHSKHHQAYVDNLNKALVGSGLEEASLEEIFENIHTASPAIRNNAGGHYNHSLFWNFIKPQGGGNPKGKLAEAINEYFGSFEAFQQKFAETALGRFGSGWVWLIVDKDNKLVISTTPYQDNPLMCDADVVGLSVLGLDVWEHAYYLNYQNKRADYVKAFWSIVNWEFAEQRFEKTQS